MIVVQNSNAFAYFVFTSENFSEKSRYYITIFIVILTRVYIKYILNWHGDTKSSRVEFLYSWTQKLYLETLKFFRHL